MRLLSIIFIVALLGSILTSNSFAKECNACPNQEVCKTVVDQNINPFKRLLLKRSCEENECKVPLFRKRTVIREKIVIRKETPILAPVKNMKRIPRAERCGARGTRRFFQRLQRIQLVRKLLRWRPLRNRCCH